MFFLGSSMRLVPSGLWCFDENSRASFICFFLGCSLGLVPSGLQEAFHAAALLSLCRPLVFLFPYVYFPALADIFLFSVLCVLDYYSQERSARDSLSGLTLCFRSLYLSCCGSCLFFAISIFGPMRQLSVLSSENLTNSENVLIPRAALRIVDLIRALHGYLIVLYSVLRSAVVTPSAFDHICRLCSVGGDVPAQSAVALASVFMK